MKKYLPLIVILISVIIAFGCKEEETTPETATVTDTDYDNIANMIAQSYYVDGNDELNMMYDTVAISEGQNPAGSKASNTIIHNGVYGSTSISYQFTMYDENDNEMAVFDPMLTAKIMKQVTVDGNWSSTRVDKDWNRTNNLTVTGLIGDNATVIINGTGSSSVNNTFQALYSNFSSSYIADRSHTYTDVTLSTDSVNNPYPLSGTALFTYHVKKTRSNNYRDVEVEFDVNAELTFNGTSTPVLVVNKNRTYDVNLNTGSATTSSAGTN